MINKFTANGYTGFYEEIDGKHYIIEREVVKELDSDEEYYFRYEIDPSTLKQLVSDKVKVLLSAVKDYMKLHRKGNVLTNIEDLNSQYEQILKELGVEL